MHTDHRAVLDDENAVLALALDLDGNALDGHTERGDHGGRIVAVRRQKAESGRPVPFSPPLMWAKITANTAISGLVSCPDFTTLVNHSMDLSPLIRSACSWVRISPGFGDFFSGFGAGLRSVEGEAWELF